MRAPKRDQELHEAAPHPCSACPWRTSNHGMPHPHGWYTDRNRDRLWVGLRRGDSMSCHPTDPDNPVPEGARVVAQDSNVRECAGGLVLQQREVMKFQWAGDLKGYRRANPRGLTTEGLATIANRAFYGGKGIPFFSGLPMARVNLNEPVSHKPLGIWSPP